MGALVNLAPCAVSVVLSWIAQPMTLLPQLVNTLVGEASPGCTAANDIAANDIAANDIAANDIAANDIKEETNHSMPPITILIADDHSLFRKGLASLLAVHQDFRVVGEAVDGAQAVEKANALHPDLILMDVRMPGLGGIEALRRIRSQQPDIRVVMLSASESDEDINEAIRCGANGYILKSTEPDDLFGELKKAIQGEIIVPAAAKARLQSRKIRLSESPGDS
jgi:CheY-like chemotaxis protein